MHAKFRFAFLFPLAAFLACGSTPTPSSPASNYLNLTGDWVVIANPITLGVAATPVSDFVGALQSSGGTVTGTWRAISLSQCVSFTQDLLVTGSIDANGKLTLTVPMAGGTATITAMITSPESYTTGTWQISGGACAMPATTISIVEFAPATGTYIGVVNVVDTTTGVPVAGTATDVTVALIQTTTPNADGNFPLSGTITATGACTGSFPVTNEVVAGGIFLPVFASGSPGVLGGGIIPTGTLLSASFFPGSVCGSQDYFGTLTRQ